MDEEQILAWTETVGENRWIAKVVIVTREFLPLRHIDFATIN